MLTKDVENVGRAGDVKDVADGYGRNFLLRRKLAVRAGTGVETEAKRLKDAAVKRETKGRGEGQGPARRNRNQTGCARAQGRGPGQAGWALPHPTPAAGPAPPPTP